MIRGALRPKTRPTFIKNTSIVHPTAFATRILGLRCVPLSSSSTCLLETSYDPDSALERHDDAQNSSNHDQHKRPTLPQIRSLLRSILHECRHLPDPAAAQYLAHHALSRFRDYPQSSLTENPERYRIILRNARRSLHQLQAANAGHSKPMMKALLLTYGRTGKRKHEYLKPLLEAKEHQQRRTPDAPTSATYDFASSNSDTMPLRASHSSEKYKPAKPFTDPITAALDNHPNTPHLAHLRHIPHLTPALTCLLRAQKSQRNIPNLTDRSGRLPRGLQLKIPEKSIWEVPLAQKRVKNIAIRWYKDVVSKALPPLPREDWERLGRLAMGEMRFGGWDGRGRAVLLGERKGEEDEKIAVPAAKSTRLANEEKDEDEEEHEEHSALEKMLRLVPWDLLAERNKGRHRPHHITPRFMRRLWLKVWETCPVMEWDAAKEDWDAKWGQPKRNRARVMEASANATSGVLMRVSPACPFDERVSRSVVNLRDTD